MADPFNVNKVRGLHLLRFFLWILCLGWMGVALAQDDIVVQPSEAEITLRVQQPEFTSGILVCVLQCLADPAEPASRLACSDARAGETVVVSVPLTMAIGCLRAIAISEAGLISAVSSNRANVAPGPPLFVP